MRDKPTSIVPRTDSERRSARHATSDPTAGTTRSCEPLRRAIYTERTAAARPCQNPRPGCARASRDAARVKHMRRTRSIKVHTRPVRDTRASPRLRAASSSRKDCSTVSSSTWPFDMQTSGTSAPQALDIGVSSPVLSQRSVKSREDARGILGRRRQVRKFNFSVDPLFNHHLQYVQASHGRQHVRLTAHHPTQVCTRRHSFDRPPRSRCTQRTAEVHNFIAEASARSAAPNASALHPRSSARVDDASSGPSTANVSAPPRMVHGVIRHLTSHHTPTLDGRLGALTHVLSSTLR